MVEAGEQLHWDRQVVVDKHSVGGLPGNRTSPIVVAIVAACGLIIPKTSSRAITSPAGTADAMETVTRVDLGPTLMRKVVEQEGGCLAWGGALNLSPADEIFIGVERQLDVDPEGQLIASVLSKKIAAGATRVVLDVPVGPTAKVRSQDSAEKITRRLTQIGSRFGVDVRCLISDGMQPVGGSVGPALEMLDALSVLRGTAEAPTDLRDRALALAAAVISLGKGCPGAEANELARRTLKSGSAYTKFERICLAQGGFREPARAKLQHTIVATSSGRVSSINNRGIARLREARRGARHACRGSASSCPPGRSGRDRTATDDAVCRHRGRACLPSRLCGRDAGRNPHRALTWRSSFRCRATSNWQGISASLTAGEVGQPELRQFPDGETYVCIQSDVKLKDVFVVCTLAKPDSQFVPLCFTAAAIAGSSAQRA